MTGQSRPDRDTEDLTRAALVLGRPWTIRILFQLWRSPQRFGELAANLPGISTNLLAERLRTLSDDGLIARSPTPTSTTYALVDNPPLQALLRDLVAWGAHLNHA